MKRLLLYVLALSAYACGNESGSDVKHSDDFNISGSLASISTVGFAKPTGTGGPLYATGTSTRVTKTITHVMAINPEVASPMRFISPINSSGAFTLPVRRGRPYVLVFIAKNEGLAGPDMIAGTFRLAENDLDTIPVGPITATTTITSTNLGIITVNGMTKEGAPTLTFNIERFLNDLGITSDQAVFMGGMDDLSLRAANPDVDGNGEIDAMEGLSFNQDWHIRANMTIGTSTRAATFADITGKYLEGDGPNVATITFDLGSAYAVYPDYFSPMPCPVNGGVSTALMSGCAFRITDNKVDVTSLWPNSSFSGGKYPNGTSWGPDYRLTGESTQDLPGSGTTSVTMEYAMPNGKTLTFSNVKTRSKSTLSKNGTVLPFLKINTADGTASGTIVSIDYQWKKLMDRLWVNATTDEVDILVNEQGAYAKFYTQKSVGVEVGVSFSIPKSSAKGTVSWTSQNIASSSMPEGTSAPDIALLTPSRFCSSAVSYDDKLGLRIFAGGLSANTGITPCY
jgi:hypothetical protein